MLILLAIKNTSFLRRIMEWWNAGIVEYWVLELNKPFYEKRQNTFKPITPIFHYSNCERSEL